MSKDKILVVWSNYYKDLAEQQLTICQRLLSQAKYAYAIETIDAGTYAIPSVIQSYHRKQPYAGYLPLGLLLKGSTDHYEFIWEHVKECFIQFALNGILIGNGIISAYTMDIMIERIQNEERIAEAIREIAYLIQLNAKL